VREGGYIRGCVTWQPVGTPFTHGLEGVLAWHAGDLGKWWGQGV
jgi:hypothetical protein